MRRWVGERLRQALAMVNANAAVCSLAVELSGVIIGVAGLIFLYVQLQMARDQIRDAEADSKRYHQQVGDAIAAVKRDSEFKRRPYVQFARSGKVFLTPVLSAKKDVEQTYVPIEIEPEDPRYRELPTLENLGEGPGLSVSLVWNLSRTNQKTVELPNVGRGAWEETEVMLSFEQNAPQRINLRAGEQIPMQYAPRSISSNVVRWTGDVGIFTASLISPERRELDTMKVVIEAHLDVSEPHLQFHFDNWACGTCDLPTAVLQPMPETDDGSLYKQFLDHVRRKKSGPYDATVPTPMTAP